MFLVLRARGWALSQYQKHASTKLSLEIFYSKYSQQQICLWALRTHWGDIWGRIGYALEAHWERIGGALGVHWGRIGLTLGMLLRWIGNALRKLENEGYCGDDYRLKVFSVLFPTGFWFEDLIPLSDYLLL